MVQCEGWSAAANTNGNVYVIGEFYQGAVTLGNIMLIDATGLSGGIYLYALAANGRVLVTQKMVVE